MAKLHDKSTTKKLEEVDAYDMKEAIMNKFSLNSAMDYFNSYEFKQVGDMPNLALIKYYYHRNSISRNRSSKEYKIFIIAIISWTRTNLH